MHALVANLAVIKADSTDNRISQMRRGSKKVELTGRPINLAKIKKAGPLVAARRWKF